LDPSILIPHPSPLPLPSKRPTFKKHSAVGLKVMVVGEHVLKGYNGIIDAEVNPDDTKEPRFVVVIDATHDKRIFFKSSLIPQP
jgi:hypothetical protein